MAYGSTSPTLMHTLHLVLFKYKKYSGLISIPSLHTFCVIYLSGTLYNTNDHSATSLSHFSWVTYGSRAYCNNHGLLFHASIELYTHRDMFQCQRTYFNNSFMHFLCNILKYILNSVLLVLAPILKIVSITFNTLQHSTSIGIKIKNKKEKFCFMLTSSFCSDQH